MNKKKQMQEAVEANQIMSEKFKSYDERYNSAADSDVERTNQKIQKEFYENDKESNFLSFHIDVNNPPMKKQT